MKISACQNPTSVDDAIDEIRSFYRRFHSIRYVGRLLAVRLKTSISPEQVAGLHDAFGDLLSEGTFELRGPLPEELDEPDLRNFPRLTFISKPPEREPVASADRPSQHPLIALHKDTLVSEQHHGMLPHDGRFPHTAPILRAPHRRALSR